VNTTKTVSRLTQILIKLNDSEKRLHSLSRSVECSSIIWFLNKERNMQFIRQIYEDLPDFIPIPDELKHSKAEVIILPLEPQRIPEKKTTLKSLLAELAAINAQEPIEMEFSNRIDRANPFLDEEE
jgi:hypothetical protein